MLPLIKTYLLLVALFTFSNSFVAALINPALSFFTSFSIAFLSSGIEKYFSAHKFISIIIGSKSIPFRVNLYNTFALLSGWSDFLIILFSSNTFNLAAKILVAIPSGDFKKSP